MEKKIIFHKIGWNLIVGSLVGFFVLFFLTVGLDITLSNSPQMESQIIAMVFILGFFSWSYSRYLYSKEKNENKRKNKLRRNLTD